MKNKKYKDSGIPWIGMIPSDWEYLKFKYSGKFEKGKLPAYTNNDGIGNPIIGASEMNGKTPTLYTEQIDIPMCSSDDILILWDGANAGLIANNQQGVVSSTAVKYACKDNQCDKEYIYYQYKTFERYFRSKVSGTTIPHMNMKFINDCPLLLPPLPTQQRIADFLDKKCAEIDELAALQETMIAELKRYKQSVITEAVTKGLDKNVKMKDSGEEWIGDIPEGWEMRAIKTMATLKSGSNITTNDIKEEKIGFPVYGGNGLRGYYSEYSDDGNYALIGRQGALCGNINYAHGKFWATDHCVVCYPKVEFELIWFGETLRTMNLNQYSLSSAQPGLSVERIKEKLMPVPPLSEQQAIADYLDEKCSEIDELIAIKQQKIEQLKEYKKSVIFEYVTGKKEVRE